MGPSGRRVATVPRVRTQGWHWQLQAVTWMLTVLALVLTSGCTSSQPAGEPDPSQAPAQVSLRVEPAQSRLVDPVSVTVTGLEPQRLHTVTVTSDDGGGVRWTSSAQFRSSTDGTLVLDEARALEGSYQGVNGMGLMETLQPEDSTAEPAYYFWTGSPQEFRIEVVADENLLAQTEFRRQLGPGVRRTEQTVSKEGFDGTFYRHSDRGAYKRRPAILAFGGSEGGNSMELPGTALAAEGYPTLTVAYFGKPGLPKSLRNIPLEYFATALRWLRKQPGVDPSRIYVLGVSRGSEAAQLVAVRYPRLVHGVVAVVPSGVVHAGLRGARSSSRAAGESAWSFQGRPVPWTRTVNEPRPDQFPRSVIPVEDIDGPMLLVCGGADQVWDSCAFARAIVSGREQHHVPHRSLLLAFPQAGHGVGSLVPHDPEPMYGPLSGTHEWSNHRARARLWGQLTTFLRTTSGAGD